jgi:hypothetical protein
MVPSASNDGARRGHCVHALFECLLNPRHKKHYQSIIEKKTIRGLPVVERFIRSHMKREKILTKNDNKGNHNFDLIDQMILVGLLYDFYCTEGKLEKAETVFSYSNKAIGYTIRGMIDKMSRHRDILKIYDYKTSAKVFEGEDLQSNIQAMMYSLYARRVRNMDAVVKFIFLRFPDFEVPELKFNKEVLDGFEQYLAHISNYLGNFSLKDAYSNFAADKPYPKKGEGFKGPLVCGYGKYPGHKDKTGREYWVCDYKWPFDYYALINKKSGKVMDTAMEKKDLTETKNSFIEKRYYSGCPKFVSLNI